MRDRRALGVASLLAAALIIAAAAVPSDVVGAEAPQDSFVATYRIADAADPAAKPTTRTETVRIRRPYDGALGVRVSNREFSWQLDDRGKAKYGFRRPPAGPLRETAFQALADAAEAGVIERRGNGEALGRRCAWFVTENPPPQQLTAPTVESRVETCVDATSIPLREIWTVEDRVVRTTEIVELELGGTSDRDFLYGKDPEKTDVTEEDVAEMLRSQSVVADDVPTPKVPFDIRPIDGWRHDRSSVVVEGAVGGSRPGQFAADAFSRGAELVVVERALRPGDLPSWALDEGEPIDAGIGTGRLLFSADRVELRITTGEGFVRIFAPSVKLARRFAAAIRVRD